MHLRIHLEQFLSQSSGKGISNLWRLVRLFILLLKFLFELLNFNETLLTHFHLLLHNKLLTALLSNVGAIKLVELLLIILKHFFLLFLSHTGNSIVLFKTVLTLSDSLSYGKLFILWIQIFLPLASHHVLVIGILLFHLSVNLVWNGLLLKVNGPDTTLLLSVFQLLKTFKSLLLKICFSIIKIAFSDKLHSKFGLRDTKVLSQFNLLLHVLLIHFLANTGFFFSMQTLNHQICLS